MNKLVFKKTISDDFSFNRSLINSLKEEVKTLKLVDFNSKNIIKSKVKLRIVNIYSFSLKHLLSHYCKLNCLDKDIPLYNSYRLYNKEFSKYIKLNDELLSTNNFYKQYDEFIINLLKLLDIVNNLYINKEFKNKNSDIDYSRFKIYYEYYESFKTNINKLNEMQYVDSQLMIRALSLINRYLNHVTLTNIAPNQISWKDTSRMLDKCKKRYKIEFNQIEFNPPIDEFKSIRNDAKIRISESVILKNMNEIIKEIDYYVK